MLSLEGIRWGKFIIGELFEILPGKRLRKEDMTPGDTPFIGASDHNNGVTAFIADTNASEDSNVLGVNYNGSVTECFYHPYTCLFSDDVKRFHLKGREGNKYIYLFVKTVIRKQKVKYSYGYKFNDERMRRQEIMLPVDDTGNPEWSFMEDFMREKEQALIREYITHLKAELADAPVKMPEFEGRKWAGFRIGDLFEILPGKRLRKEDMTPGDTPFIGASDHNNGVTAFIADTNASEDSNVLGVNYDGSVTEGFYHPYTCLFSDSVKRFHLKGHEGNKYIYLFVKAAIRKQKVKYSYGYKFNDERMRRQEIMLPVNDNGNPDYVFMEEFMRSKEKEMLKKYLAYLEERLEQ